MVGIDESSLTNLANKNVPISESNPQNQGDGSDHDSVGVFQQRISEDWSTISSNPNDAAAVNQLMTPAYAAEAFFGSPPGSNAPPALSKGLQNVSGWQSLAPQVAAQRVQNPGNPPNAGDINYQNEVLKTQARAQSLLTQYWDSAPAVALPVPISGGSGGSSGGSNNAGGCSSGASCNGSGATASTASGSIGQAVCFLCATRTTIMAIRTVKAKHECLFQIQQ